MKWYIQAFKKYAVFSGRARRKEYWFFVLFNIIVAMILGFIDGMSGNFSPETGIGLLGGLYTLIALVPGISVSVRRLHDTGRSGWWLLIGFIPIVGAIVLLVFFVQDGDAGHNEYGANPKGTTVPAF
ncbi:MAG: DUF805 domain-containing protein [Balneolaceae bacterium]|nr:DUF805 domain-containing protein [Balneolaceae bacterium]